MKIRPVGSELFHADGRTDGQTDGGAYMTKLIAAFRNFANAPENVISKRSTNTYVKICIHTCLLLRHTYICSPVCETDIKFQNMVYFNT